MTNNRKKVSDPTKKVLFAKSMNKCAFPDCYQQIIDEYGKVNGEICHIHGVNKNSARYNSEITHEQQVSEENLIILCPTHHTIIDKNESQFTVSDIKNWKYEHEKIYENAIKNLAEVESAVDTTRNQQVINFSTLSKLKKCLRYNDEQLEDAKNELTNLADILKNITKDTRDVFFSILYRYNTENYISIKEIEISYQSKEKYVEDRLIILKSYRLVDIEIDDENNKPYVMVANNINNIIYDLIELSNSGKIDLEEIILNLNFTELD
ncbi:hypothetical protein [Staphylococcus shinii]|uniref:hypothetical protein n=1 Tax=Staphylococcus shinii TaxID=2912228 RepID=UPI0035147E85